jgi:hypothetical protein
MKRSWQKGTGREARFIKPRITGRTPKIVKVEYE